MPPWEVEHYSSAPWGTSLWRRERTTYQVGDETSAERGSYRIEDCTREGKRCLLADEGPVGVCRLSRVEGGRPSNTRIPPALLKTDLEILGGCARYLDWIEREKRVNAKQR